MESDKKQIEDYLHTKVNPIFQTLLLDISKSQPRNILTFCKAWFEKKVQQNKIETKKHIQSDSQSDDEEDFLAQEVIEQKKTKPRWYKQRKAICGEVYGSYNRLDDYEIANIVKTPAVNNRILFRLKSLFMFKDFDQEDISKLISAMTEVTYEKSTVIIRQGDEGNQIYILDEGELHCYRRSEGQKIYIRTIMEGEMFGQISMLYNTKRSANIRAKQKAICFKLDRKTFNAVIRQKNLKKRKIVMDIMKKIDVLRGLQIQEKQRIQDIVKEMHAHQNQCIIKEGKINDKLFMVERGKLVGLKKQKNGHERVTQNYNDGDYFGLNSLTTYTPSINSVIALTTSKLYYVQISAIENVIGPLQKISERNGGINENSKII